MPHGSLRRVLARAVACVPSGSVAPAPLLVYRVARTFPHGNANRGVAPRTIPVLRHVLVLLGTIAATESSRPASRRRLDWASLLKRVFATDVLVCDAGGGAMRILAILPDGDASRAILEHLRLPTEPPAPGAVGPPERGCDDALA